MGSSSRGPVLHSGAISVVLINVQLTNDRVDISIARLSEENNIAHLPTVSVAREILGIGSIPVAILPTCQDIAL